MLYFDDRYAFEQISEAEQMINGYQNEIRNQNGMRWGIVLKESGKLIGTCGFSGRLPEPWYESVNQIGKDEYWFEAGYGLSYQDGFIPVQEPEAIPDAD